MKTKVMFAALALAATSAFAQYPNKPVTIVVGFEPGGGTDTTARIVQGPLGEQLGQQIVVENRAGAGGNIAVDHVAKAAPDGYTIVLANVGALAVNPHILKTPYDPLKDLAPISMAAEFANVLVVQPVARREYGGRFREARESEARHHHLRFVRHRRRGTSFRRAPAENGKHRHRARALQRRRSGDAGLSRRPGRIRSSPRRSRRSRRSAPARRRRSPPPAPSAPR